jgi:uridine phosphorylase
VNRTTPRAADRLVVAAPLRIEARALRRGAPDVRVVRTGMGPDRARHAMARLRVDPAARLVVAGFCGALDATLVPGDVVVASELRGAAHRSLEVCQDLVTALEGQGLRVRVAPLVSVPRIARGAERRALQGCSTAPTTNCCGRPSRATCCALRVPCAASRAPWIAGRAHRFHPQWRPRRAPRQ